MRTLMSLTLVLVAQSALAQDVASTIDRGLAFLAKDSLAWKKEHNCVSCHHGALVAWALRDAKQHGIPVDEPVLAEMTKWTAESGSGKTGIPRPPGIPKALNAKAVWFSLALQSDRKPDETVQAGLKLLLATVKEDQTDSGAWASWPETRPPIFGNSDESMTVLATLALLPAAQAGDESAIAARDKGVRWLVETKTDDDPQSVAMRLVLWNRLNRPPEELAPLIQRIHERQREDGGWSQATGRESDAWATGQALYALSVSGLKSTDATIASGRQFLTKTQREDGSWPMMSRPTKSDGEYAKGQVAITGAGAAWAVIGLVHSK